MYIEAILATIASAASVGAIVRIVRREAKRLASVRKQEQILVESYIARRNEVITVTKKGTDNSVELPAHYDRKAISKFLELTA